MDPAQHTNGFTPDFAPAEVRSRRDGWTPQKQHGFLVALGETGIVAEAAKAAGMTVTSAYRLRARPEAKSFREAWEAATDFAMRNLQDAVLSRAIHGVSTPIFYKGEQIGESRKFNDALAMFLLRYHVPRRYSRAHDKDDAPRGSKLGEERAARFSEKLDQLEDFSEF